MKVEKKLTCPKCSSNDTEKLYSGFHCWFCHTMWTPEGKILWSPKKGYEHARNKVNRRKKVMA